MWIEIAANITTLVILLFLFLGMLGLKFAFCWFHVHKYVRHIAQIYMKGNNSGNKKKSVTQSIFIIIFFPERDGWNEKRNFAFTSDSRS